MTHASLFSGIGGPDLAAEWMGWENIFHCEINPFGQKILKHYWPNATLYENIKTTDFSIHRGTIDVLTGGFPYQPYSLAGLRKGKEDERHLWPEMLRAIREVKPRWVVGENVLGLVGWNDGLVFEEVQADLEAEGYEVQPYVLPAAGVGAPHQRYRVWFVAYCADAGSKGLRPERTDSVYGSEVTTDSVSRRHRGLSEITREQEDSARVDGPCKNGVVANSDNLAFNRITNNRINGETFKQQREETGIAFGMHSLESTHDDEYANGERLEESNSTTISNEQSRISSFGPVEDWSQWPTQPPICDGNDGISSGLDGITFSKWRTESIKAGGNAIVPQVIHQIFKAIETYENNT